MNYHQPTIFDPTSHSLNQKISELLNCHDEPLLTAIALAVENFQALPQERKYQIAFSGGKDSCVLLGIYCLYLKLGNQPLDMAVVFSDTELEHESLYQVVNLVQDFATVENIPFDIVKGKQSYWFVQFVLGYPVPNHFNRWCTSELKILKFDCFCPKVFSSVHPFHTDPEFSEFRRRLLTVPTARAEDMKGVDPSSLLDFYEYDWTGLETEVKQYWTYQKAEEYLHTRKNVSRGLRLKSEQKIVCVDFATTAIVTGIWHSIHEANTRFDDYFAWLKAETEEERDNLEKMLSQLITQEMAEAKVHGMTECRIRITRLRGLITTWYEQGYLLEPADRKQVRRFMQENGFKTRGSESWIKKF